tara:strand:+ start:24911 stop:25504 length:594 start_codon:yes stop_codon:yes gene_type:complete
MLNSIEYLKISNGKDLEGPILIKNSIFSDSRGTFFESWNKFDFNKILDKEINFVQDNISFSSKGVLRGLHFQLQPFQQSKLVRCINGSIYDVVVDIRSSSPTFGKWSGVFLDDQNNYQLWIPEGFAHGFIAKTNQAKILYKVTNPWMKSYERCLLWRDQDINVSWPMNNINGSFPIISEKDKLGKTLKYLVDNNEVF